MSLTLQDVITAFDLDIGETMSEGDPVARAYYEALSVAAKVRERWEQEHGRKMDAVDHALAATIFIEKNRAAKAAAPRQQQPAPTQNGGVTVCPQCGGAVWDNRAKNQERAREGKKAMPIYTCKDKDGCGWAQWPPKNKPQTVPAPAPQASPFAPDDDDLGF